MEKAQEIEILDTGILAGKIMMESGSEMYRVQDTVRRILLNGGLYKPEIFATPTGLFVSSREIDYTKMAEVTEHAVNLEKVTRVNTLSRKFAEKSITITELREGLRNIDEATEDFPLWLQLIGAFLVSSTMMILFTGKYDWIDLIPSGFVGMMGYLIDYYITKVAKLKFISEFIACVCIAFVGMLFYEAHIINHLNYLIIGAVMPLVPGVAMTNALRDLISGHLLAGIARMTDGILSAMAIGGGIALVLRFLM